MALRPGYQIILSQSHPPRTAPTDTGVLFVAGITEKGPVNRPTLLTSMSDYSRIFGARVSYSLLYDAIEAFFREGGTKVYVMRVVGPSATSSAKMLLDSGAANTLQVVANSPGAWGAGLKIAVLAGDAGGNFKLQILDSTNVVLETSPDLVDKTAALAWAQYSSYITLVDQGTSVLDPATLAATALTGGADDRANAVDSSYKAALDLATPDYGPGQVAYPGRTTDQAHLDLLTHAAANNRFALLDAADTATKATLKAAVAAARAGGNGQYGAMYGPWAICPGITAGTVRTIPYSTIQAGLFARSDAKGNPNQAAAGINGIAQFAIGLSQPSWSASDVDDLNTSGFNVVKLVFSQVRTYGNRSLVDPVTNPNWLEVSGNRLIMAIVAEAENVLESHVFDQLDGAGVTLSAVQGELTGICIPFFNIGALYGATPREAFSVDTGPSVNTPTTIANRELHAVMALRTSPGAELVVLELVKVPITEEVA